MVQRSGPFILLTRTFLFCFLLLSCVFYASASLKRAQASSSVIKKLLSGISQGIEQTFKAFGFNKDGGRREPKTGCYLLLRLLRWERVKRTNGVAKIKRV